MVKRPAVLSRRHRIIKRWFFALELLAHGAELGKFLRGSLDVLATVAM
jgi:hypothetical protein